MVIIRRLGVHRILDAMRHMTGSIYCYRMTERRPSRLPDDVDEFLTIPLQRLFGDWAGSSGYIEMTRVMIVWEQLQLLDPATPLHTIDIEEILHICAAIERPCAIRALITRHNEGQLVLSARRFNRVGREVGMRLRVMPA